MAFFIAFVVAFAWSSGVQDLRLVDSGIAPCRSFATAFSIGIAVAFAWSSGVQCIESRD